MNHTSIFTSDDESLTVKDYRERHERVANVDTKESESNPRSSGRFEPMMRCLECDGLCWRDKRMSSKLLGEIWCESCGLYWETHFSEKSSNGSRFHGQTSGVNGLRSGLQKISPKNAVKYDNSGVTRLHGGYERGYYGNGEYEFGQMDQTLID